MAGQTCIARARSAARRLSLLGCVTAVLAVAPGTSQAAVLQWEPSAGQFWAVNGDTILNVFQNGQCTQWAEQRRPDVVQQIIEGVVSQELANHQVEAMPDLDARYWTSDAQQVGIPTGRQPRAGALVVFQPGVLGAGPAGHIAYVVRVNRRGSFLISEMHAPTLYHVTRRRLRAAAGRLPGVSFIY
jgi:surface antigen